MSEKSTLAALREQEREVRKNLIIDAAKKVFASNQYDRVSMKEIAQEAGIGTSTIYSYFPNQEALFLEASLRETGIITGEIESISLLSLSPKEKLGRVITTFIEYITNHESYFRMQVLFMTYGNLTDESLEKLNHSMRHAFDVFDKLFYDIGYTGDVRRLSHFFFATLNGILVTYRKFPGHDENQVMHHMEELGELFRDMILAQCPEDKNV